MAPPEPATPTLTDDRPSPAGGAPTVADASAAPDAAGSAIPEVLTTAMAANLLHVHVEYLRKMVRDGRIPAHRFPGGREIRFLRDELIDWVRAQPGHNRSTDGFNAG